MCSPTQQLLAMGGLPEVFLLATVYSLVRTPSYWFNQHSNISLIL